jgi:hypothetical protein
MVSVKGSEIKEISERAGARESRERTESERENAEGATRVLEALGEAGAERRIAAKPADPVSAVFVPVAESCAASRSSLSESSARQYRRGLLDDGPRAG